MTYNTCKVKGGDLDRCKCPCYSPPIPSIDLPPSLFEQIQDATSLELTQSITAGVVFTFYEKSTLFPVGEHIKMAQIHQK